MNDLLKVVDAKSSISGEWPRPPGAVEAFATLCDGCDECMLSCPHGAIGKLRDGTPALNPAAVACHLCDDLPCVVSCPTGALLPIEPELIFFGLARIIEEKCFVFMGPECGACAAACPTKAISLPANKPHIELDECNGCGLCKEACPVFYGSAIAIDV